MNYIIDEQLKKCKVADIPEYTLNDLNLFIPKKGNNNYNDIEVNKTYVIKVEQYILHPPEGFTLHTNWNKGVIPTSEYMSVRIQKIMGKMVHITAVDFDIISKKQGTVTWEGWLPRKSFQVINIY